MLGAKGPTDKTLLSKYNNTIAVRERQSGEDGASETRGKDTEEEEDEEDEDHLTDTLESKLDTQEDEISRFRTY